MSHRNLFALAGAFALGVTAALAAQEAGEPIEASSATLSLPGPMHQHLDGLLGEWTLHGKWRESPDGPWEEFEARARREWVLGDRFVKETVESDLDGAPFEATSYLGYDNVRKEYVMVWLENASTGLQLSTGQIDERGRTLTFEGSNSNAATGRRNAWHRSVVSLSEPDRTLYAGFARDESGQEFQNLEMIADRD